MPYTDLPRSTPAAEGVDAAGIQALLDAFEADPDIEPHSLMVLRHGRLIASGWWAPYTPERPHLLYSLSKTFTVTAAGLAAAEGLLSLDDLVLSYFPELEPEASDPRFRELRIRHVASMATGHLEEALDRALAACPGDLLRGFLRVPPDRDPGTVFAYNQPATYTLAAILQRVTGGSLTEYLRPRLLDPLGIGETYWQRDRAGRELGFSGLHATTDAVARIGQLYLGRGVWQGRRLLPESWVEEATRIHIDNSDRTDPDALSDWQQGYGLQFWRSRHGYRGDGAFGQYCLVLPEQDAVVAMTSQTVGMQRELDLIWKHLLPAFGGGSLSGPAKGDSEAAEVTEDAALADRMSRLALPPLTGLSGAPRNAGAWDGAAFTPAGPSGDGSEDRPALTGAEVAFGPGGWTLTLCQDEDRLVLTLGDGDGDGDGDGACHGAGGGDGGGWTVGEDPVPLAVTGGWQNPDTLTVDVLFLETPHRLCVTCALTDRVVTARWLTPPLQPGPLRRMAAPRRTAE